MEDNTYQDDNLTLQDLIRRIRPMVSEVRRYWLIPAVCILLVLAYKAYIYFNYQPLYPATITFSVDEDEGGGASGLTGILGQFGLGSVKPTRYNLDKILALSKSRRVVQQSLFTRLELHGKDDFMANHIIRQYGMTLMDEKDGKTPVEFYFTHDSLPIFSTRENQMLLNVYGAVVGDPNNPKNALLRANYNDDTNIMSIDVQTTDEQLSISLAKQMFESLSTYYVSKSIEKQLRTYTVVGFKRDSVLAELKAAEYQLASFKDSHRGLVMRVDQVTEMRLQREIAALTVMYAEVLKNTEVADFGLKNKTPFIQVIDEPISPIRPVLLSPIRNLAIGIFLGGLLGVVIVLGRWFWRENVSQSLN